MFLISWRGYWQELIETLVWAHESTPKFFGTRSKKKIEPSKKWSVPYNVKATSQDIFGRKQLTWHVTY